MIAVRVPAVTGEDRLVLVAAGAVSEAGRAGPGDPGDPAGPAGLARIAETDPQEVHRAHPD